MVATKKKESDIFEYNRNNRSRCEICSKLTIRTPYSNVSIVNFEQVSTG